MFLFFVKYQVLLEIIIVPDQGMGQIEKKGTFHQAGFHILYISGSGLPDQVSNALIV
jgi:hypothetical protein